MYNGKPTRKGGTQSKLAKAYHLGYAGAAA